MIAVASTPGTCSPASSRASMKSTKARISGWLTAAIVMRLRVQSIRVVGGMIGAGAEQMRWTEPVRPGDTIRTEIEVVGVRYALG